MGPGNPAVELFQPEDLRSAVALRHRYHELLKLYHPDRHSGEIEWANLMVRAVIAAYDTLKTQIGIGAARHGPPDLRAVIVDGDDALRRAVLFGWLRRLPRQARDLILRRRIFDAREALVAHPGGELQGETVDFYAALFAAFLDATDLRLLQPLPYRWSTPHTFRDLRSANELLEKGIRDYYHHRERGRLATIGIVAASYLEDATRFYSYVSRRIEDPMVKEVVQSRISLARGFIERIRRRRDLDVT